MDKSLLTLYLSDQFFWPLVAQHFIVPLHSHCRNYRNKSLTASSRMKFGSLLRFSTSIPAWVSSVRYLYLHFASQSGIFPELMVYAESRGFTGVHQKSEVFSDQFERIFNLSYIQHRSGIIKLICPLVAEWSSICYPPTPFLSLFFSILPWPWSKL